MPLDENIKKILSDPDNAGITVEEAQEAYSAWKIEQERHQKLAQAPRVSAGQVGAEQNRPLSVGLAAGVSEASRSFEEISSILAGQPLTAGMGLLRATNIPGAAMGGAVGQTTQNVLGNIPGLGGPSGVVPSGAAAVADAITQMFIGPGMIKGAIGGVKAVGRGITKFVAPGELREAGVEVVAGKLGRPQDLIKRVMAEPASKQLFKEMEKAENVPIRPLYDFVDDTLTKEMASNLPEVSTINVLNKLKGSLSVSLANPNISQSYGALADTTQRLGGLARALIERKPNTAKNLYELRATFLDKMDEISPAIKNANRVYRKELATDEILLSLRGNDPGTQFKRMLESDRSLASAFDSKTLTEIKDLAEEMSSIAASVPSGGFRQVMSVITEGPRTLIASERGRALLRRAMTPVKETGKVNPTRIFAAVQLWKAKEHATEVAESMKDANIPTQQKIEVALEQDRLEKQLEQTIGGAP